MTHAAIGAAGRATVAPLPPPRRCRGESALNSPRSSLPSLALARWQPSVQWRQPAAGSDGELAQLVVSATMALFRGPVRLSTSTHLPGCRPACCAGAGPSPRCGLAARPWRTVILRQPGSRQWGSRCQRDPASVAALPACARLASGSTLAQNQGEKLGPRPHRCASCPRSCALRHVVEQVAQHRLPLAPAGEPNKWKTAVLAEDPSSATAERLRQTPPSNAPGIAYRAAPASEADRPAGRTEQPRSRGRVRQARTAWLPVAGTPPGTLPSRRSS